MNTLTVVGLILGIPASIYAILAGIEARTGSRALRPLIVPVIRLKHWIGAPRRDIKELQGRVYVTVDLLSSAVKDYQRMEVTIHETAKQLYELRNQVARLEELVGETDIAELRAKVDRTVWAADRTDTIVTQHTGKLAEVESGLANFRRWVEQELTTQDGDGTGSYKSMTDVQNRFDVINKQIGELVNRVYKHTVVDAIAQQQVEPQRKSVAGKLQDHDL